MKVKKILYGVSGIGNGHANRETPLIEALSKNNKIVILAYQDSLKALTRTFGTNPNIKILEIDVPFIVGVKEGLDFNATATNPYNQDKNFITLNSKVLSIVEQEIGTPDLVISDYEPVCAQYAYAKNAPLVTIDQQSKYLYSDLPKEINGFTYEDEIQRLHMFFPKAAARIACSFFRTKPKLGGDDVVFMPPPIKKSVVETKRLPSNEKQILMYISSAREFVHTPREIIETLNKHKSATFRLFIRGTEIDEYKKLAEETKSINIKLYQHGDPKFIEFLGTCDGIMSTAGHSLLSEAMYLGIPVYAIPVEPYEQHMNAKAIGDNGFGIDCTTLNDDKIETFINTLEQYASNIKNDKTVLIRGNGQDLILYYLKKNFLSKKKILIYSPPFSGHLYILKELIKDTKHLFNYKLVITGWDNIKPDLSGIDENMVTVLTAGDLNETDPALWTFPRAEKLLDKSIKLAQDFDPDLILYDFFSIEGNLTGQILHLPYWCSIPALIGAFENQEYRNNKYNNVLNQLALKQIKTKYNLDIKCEDVEMVSDGFHLPGEVNIIWSFEEVTPKNFINGRAKLPYAFVGNLRGDNYEKHAYKNKKPMIYISFGTVVMNNLWNQQETTRENMRNFVKALAQKWNNEKYQIIFVTQGKQILDEYPQNWWVYDTVDQVDILSRADLFITHGGSNSFHEAIMQNVPMIVTPFFGDQILVSETAQSLGIGKRVGGTTSIDTHAEKDFLNKALVEKLDEAVKQVLEGYEYTYNYLHLKLNYSPIVSLITSEIPYEDGDLILGEKNLIPRSREQLPTDLEAYVEHLSTNESQSISADMDTVLNALRIYCGKSNLKQKILEYFSNTHNIHCLISATEADKSSISIAETLLKNNYGSIYQYENTNNVWVKDTKAKLTTSTKKLTNLPKKIYLTSEDATKLGALKEALTKMNISSEIIGVNPKIGVDEELVGTDNIAEAALRRLSELKKQINEPCMIVSIVSGIIKKDNKWIDTSIAVAQDEHGNTSISRSAGLVFPDALVKKAQRRGFGKHTVSSVLAEESAEHDLGVDPHIILTSGHLSRRHLLEETFIETLNKFTL